MENWQGKVAVVTGASSGIGSKIAETFAMHGIIVIGMARRIEKVEELRDELGEIGSKIYPLKCDVSSRNSIKDAFKWIEESFNTINILVNNAGVVFKKRSIDDKDDETLELIDQTISTNFNGVVHCCHGAVRLMKKNEEPSLIVNINSILGHKTPIGDLQMNVYPPTKFAVTAYSDVLRQELIFNECSRIRVTSISPGVVRTGAPVAGGFVQNPDDFYGGQLCLQPEDVSNVIKFVLECPFNINLTEISVVATGAI